MSNLPPLPAGLNAAPPMPTATPSDPKSAAIAAALMNDEPVDAAAGAAQSAIPSDTARPVASPSASLGGYGPAAVVAALDGIKAELETPGAPDVLRIARAMQRVMALRERALAGHAVLDPGARPTAPPPGTPDPNAGLHRLIGTTDPRRATMETRGPLADRLRRLPLSGVPDALLDGPRPTGSASMVELARMIAAPYEAMDAELAAADMAAEMAGTVTTGTETADDQS